MCIIAYKPHNKPVPTEETLKICWENNSDGAGFAYYVPSKESWMVEKGFMKWNKFWKAFSKHKFTEDDCLVIHFRIGTSGNKDGGNTHPFMISKDLGSMRKTKYQSKYLVVHNGVIGSGQGIYSDTMVAIQKFIDPLWSSIQKAPKNDERLMDILEKLLETGRNRWFITSGRFITRLGTWHEDENGVFYSNTHYKALKVSTTTVGTGVYGGWKHRQDGYWGNHNTYSGKTNISASSYYEQFGSAYDKAYYSTGVFDWEKWQTDQDDKPQYYGLTPSDVEQPTATTSDDSPEEDEHTGVAVFYLCAYCNNLVSETEIRHMNTDGTAECPHCNGAIDMDDEIDGDDVIEEDRDKGCPECEGTTFMDSPYNDGSDTLCMTCGCLFCVDSQVTIGYDPEVRIGKIHEGGFTW